MFEGGKHEYEGGVPQETGESENSILAIEDQIEHKAQIPRQGGGGTSSFVSSTSIDKLREAIFIN